MNLDSGERARLAASILAHLQGGIPGSTAVLRGSLAGREADQYSDIDVLWTVPNEAFAKAVAEVGAVLARVDPVESLRSDPAFHREAWRRLIFARFVDVPLFWRLDLDVVAQSPDEQDADHSAPQPADADWSRTESALMNAVAAVKAHLRGDDGRARQVLLPGYWRVGLEPRDLPLQNQIMGLVEGITRMDPGVGDLARRVKMLVLEGFEE